MTPYQTAVKQLRKAFGERSTLMPVAVLNQILSLTNEEEVLAATADIGDSNQARPHGAYFVLTSQTAIAGTWADAQPDRDLKAGTYDAQVVPRSTLVNISVRSTSGAPWISDQWEGLRPWISADVQVVALYAGCDQIALPLNHVDSTTQNVIDALLADLRR